MERRERGIPEGRVAKKTKLVRKMGKGNVLAIASLGLAATTLLGISGRLESGVGLAINLQDPLTGKQVNAGVIASSTEGKYPLGFPSVRGQKWHPDNKFSVYQVRIGNAMVGVYTEPIASDRGVIKTIGIYPGFEIKFGK